MSLDLSDGSNCYSLGVLNDMIGFYKFQSDGTTSITLGANKVYLEAPASGGPAKGFRFDFETGIEGLTPAPSPKVEGNIYNLAGQRLSKPVKGINIINGKKVINK